MKVIARQLRLVTLFSVGWCLQAQAQPTDFSLPPLSIRPIANSGPINSPMPTQPLPPNAGGKNFAVPGQSEVVEKQDAPVPAAIPELANLPTPVAAPVAASEPAAATATPATETANPP